MKKHDENTGIALIAVITVLTIISILGIYFFTVIKMHATQNALFLNDFRARLLTRAGLHLALSQLKYGSGGVRDNFCDSRIEDWYYTAGTGVELADAEDNQTSFSSLTGLRENIDLGNNREGYITLKIIDGASQINVNDTNPNLATILSNLPGMNASLASAVITYRNALPSGQFSYEEQIINVSGMTRALYEQIKYYITIKSWSDPKATISYNTGSLSTTFSGTNNARSPINVNTAPREVLIAVLTPIVPTVASSVAGNIISHVTTTPFYSWQEFDTFIDGLGLNVVTAHTIKTNANPNRIKPSGYTSEFCFHSGGYYEIEVLARVVHPNGSTAARRSAKAFVKLYDIAQHTTKSDFRDEDTNNDGDHSDSSIGEGNFDNNFGNTSVDNTNYLKVTWLDSCPINEGDDDPTRYRYFSSNIYDRPPYNPLNYETAINAVKLGFWDNFDEDTSTNQSRAWWGNAEVYPFNISDCGTAYNYTYEAADYSERGRIGTWEDGGPPERRVHTYAEDVSPGDNAFWIDDPDNEIWREGSGAPLRNITAEDFSKYVLGGQGYGSGFQMRSSYQNWDAPNGFYLRTFNFDGPRASIGTDENFPGFRYRDRSVVPPIEGVDPSGRDRQDVGRVEVFYTGDLVQFYLYPIGNVYTFKDHDGDGDSEWGAELWGDFYAVLGPLFYASCGPFYHEDSHRYQRDKVYKMVCYDGKTHYYVYASEFSSSENKHSSEYNTSSNNEGRIQLYSNANQAAWDNVRAIDDEGRIAKHFIIPDDVDVGSFHCNAFVPQGSAVYFVGDDSGSSIRIGVNDIDISSRTQETNFMRDSGAYFPDVNFTNLGPGAQAVEGPSSGGDTLYSYSIRLTTSINSLTPQVPVIEDVSLTFLPSTEILYYYEQ